MKRVVIATLLMLTYGVANWGWGCTTDANCSLIFYAEVRGGYTIVEVR